jgi:hypothetical protein
MSYFTKRAISSCKWAANLINPYSTNPQRKKTIEQLVINYAKTKGLDARGAETGIIA